MNESERLIQSAKKTISLEIKAIESLLSRINNSFVHACQLILERRGRVAVLGIGKSGHIGKKIAATLSSTGTASFFVHPSEASHGDIGMITRDDIILIISNSGSGNEILHLLPAIHHLGNVLISITGNSNSPLAKASTVHLDNYVTQEACPLNLAPTATTTASLVLGDALAMALSEFNNFTATDFALSHPGGSLGRRLLLKVKDILHSEERYPRVNSGASLKEVLIEMSCKGLGATIVINAEGKLIGVFTDGDLRRTLDQKIDIHSATIDNIMNINPKTVNSSLLATKAFSIMKENKIRLLVAVNKEGYPIGILSMYDLLQIGIK